MTVQNIIGEDLFTVYCIKDFMCIARKHVVSTLKLSMRWNELGATEETWREKILISIRKTSNIDTSANVFHVGEHFLSESDSLFRAQGYNYIGLVWVELIEKTIVWQSMLQKRGRVAADLHVPGSFLVVCIVYPVTR